MAQPHIQPPFQIGDMGADRRLADPQNGLRFDKTAGFGNGLEDP